MELRYHRDDALILDFGSYKKTYRYSVKLPYSPGANYEMKKWADKTLKVDSFRFVIPNRAYFIHKKDATWFILKWS